jgi:hypothetical protein
MEASRARARALHRRLLLRGDLRTVLSPADEGQVAKGRDKEPKWVPRWIYFVALAGALLAAALAALPELQDVALNVRNLQFSFVPYSIVIFLNLIF